MPRVAPYAYYENIDLKVTAATGFFGGMIALTRTLWEYREGKGSRDHGFASYAFVTVKRSITKLNEKNS